MKNKLKITSAVRYGGYSLIMTAIVLAIIIVLNLALAALPADLTSVTSGDDDIYKISETSVEYMKKLDTEVTVYIVAVEGSSSEHHLMIKNYVERYAALSDKISVKYIDPEIRPAFLSSYNGDGLYEEGDLSSEHTHLVIESERRAKIVSYSEIFRSALAGEELTAFLQANGYIPYSYEIETCLISGIDYVSLELLPTVYYTAGHKEYALDTSFAEFAKKENIGLKSLDLSKADGVPADAHAVVIYGPETDFEKSETSKLRDFADRGGNVLLATGYEINLKDRVLDNLYGLMTELYGVSYREVIVLDEDDHRVDVANGYFVLATATDKLPSAIPSNQGYIPFSFPHALEVSESLPEGVSVSTLLTTTKNGYAKTAYDKNFVTEKLENDIEGQFTLGVYSDRKSGEATSRLWWFSSLDSISFSYNPYLTVHVLSELAEKESVSGASITILHDTVDISSGAATLWSVIIIAVIPGAILAYGIYVRYRRARR